MSEPSEADTRAAVRIIASVNRGTFNAHKVALIIAKVRAEERERCVRAAESCLNGRTAANQIRGLK